MQTSNLTAGEQFTLHLGDNLATLKNYPDNTFDSIVTDPPYGIEFLGKDWDKHTGTLELYKECLRVLKPGGYLLAFSAARTYHQLASNIELAGFEIRDQLMWLYSSGFPKAQDIGKAIQKRLGVEETKVLNINNAAGEVNKMSLNEQTICTLPLAKEWEGFKTALKPAHEPIVMARKPFKGSTIDNVLKNGLGAMNIDATRVPWADGNEPAPGSGTPEWRTGGPVFVGDGDTKEKKKKSDKPATFLRKESSTEFGQGMMPATVYEPADGRYPSNVIGEVEEGYQKYFYCPKVSRKERHVGFTTHIETYEELAASDGGSTVGANMSDIPGIGLIYNHGLKTEVEKIRGYSASGNNHPTVKPVALMDYLIKLVTPPSTPTLQRKVLDPFMGSGSTGMAATALGHHFTGCELDPKYVAIAQTRIEAWNAPEEDAANASNDDFDRVFGT